MTHGGDIWEAARVAGKDAVDIIDFSASVAPFGLPKSAISSANDALKAAAVYPDIHMTALKEAIASYHGLAPGDVLPANGSTELIYLIPRVLKPKRALIVEPAFSDYRRSLETCGASVDSFELDEESGFKLDAASLIEKLTRGYDICYLANPANPTGALTEKAVLLELARAADTLGTVLVVDEAFCDFTESESLKREAANYKNLILLRSMTKFFSMASLRLGFMVAHPEVVEDFLKASPPWSVNGLAGAVGIALLADSDHQKKILDWFCREKPRMEERLSTLGALKVFPSSANFFMLKLTGDTNAPACKRELMKEGILIRELSDFRGLTPAFLRVALRGRKDNELLFSRLSFYLEGEVNAPLAGVI